MKIKLSKSIAEFERGDVAYIWQPPDMYNDILTDDVCLIYGRKGSGKSTIVDYLGTQSDVKVFKIRPSQYTLFNRIICYIDTNESDERVLEESIWSILDFALTVELIRNTVDFNGYIHTGNERYKIYNFMVAAGLMEGSALRKAVKIVGRFSDGYFKLIPNISQELDKILEDITFDDVKEAFYLYLRNMKIKIILCIDDIDQIGFSNSKRDRIFINSLIIYMVRSNVTFINNNVNARVLLTVPSELYFNASLWGSDWVTSKSKCLNWADVQSLKMLVNKRIGYELNVRKTKRKDKDVYSTSSEHTWGKIFPDTIYNKLGKQEPAFEYILRHTFYTPRQVLSLCDYILSEMLDGEFESNLQTKFSINIWSEKIQKGVEDYTYHVEKDFCDLFGKIYSNIVSVISLFRSRPAIWFRNQLISYLSSKNAILHKAQNGNSKEGIHLIYALQKMGFLGLGIQTILNPPGIIGYEMRFSYLENFPSKKPWEIAAISPLFYDTYDIKPVNSLVVTPHLKLNIPESDVKSLHSYDPDSNTFLT